MKSIILICALLAVSVGFCIGEYVIYKKIFVRKRYPTPAERYPVPQGDTYRPYREKLVEYMKLYDSLTHIDVYVKAFDGIRLRARYFEYSPDAPIEILVHGYRGSGFRNMGCHVERCMKLGHNALVVDQRGCGESEGEVISFGINESRDCMTWISYVQKNINKDAKIILFGVSMGASTVLCASGYDLPENVCAVIADCGFSSAKGIIKQVMKNSGQPSFLLYPLAKRGATAFGHFTPDAISPLSAMRSCMTPVMLIHGDNDKLVPYSMSKEIFDACTSEKRLVTFVGAGHTLSYISDPDKYISEITDFLSPLI